MQTLGRRYVRYINRTYRRNGTLWEGRYHASLVQGDCYLLTWYRYIELNPVRANIADGPADYRWSSYPGNALGQRDPLIEPHEDYLRLGGQAMYRGLFQVHIDPELLKAVWQATQTNRVFNADYPTRWMLIKGGFSRRLPKSERLNTSRRSTGERGLWQRRYGEHTIRDEEDFRRHVDYKHYNPVKHGYVTRPAD